MTGLIKSVKVQTLLNFGDVVTFAARLVRRVRLW